MEFKILAPSPGESVTFVTLSAWLKEDGEYVEKDEPILEIESEKASLSIVAEHSGILHIKEANGQEVCVGSIIATITEQKLSSKKELAQEETQLAVSKETLDIIVPSPGESIVEVVISSWLKNDGEYVGKDEPILEIESEKATLSVSAETNGILKIKIPAGKTANVGDVAAIIEITEAKIETQISQAEIKPLLKKEAPASPAAQKMMEENKLTNIVGTGKDGRVTKTDVVTKMQETKQQETSIQPPVFELSVAENESSPQRVIKKIPMTSLRKTLASRLVAIKNEAAMLTTFNEVNMSSIIQCRKEYKEIFKTVHDVNLGFMSFFTKACSLAFRKYPIINSFIAENTIHMPQYADIGIAVSAPKGLIVPIIRNVEQKSLADTEKEIVRLATKARDNKISISDLTGGTFTITNGGVFGSMLSTPIINPPQSAILGMHNIIKRAVVIEDEIKIAPVMYLALSYDHRNIDGKEAVSFLVEVKNYLEAPLRMLLEA